MFDTVFGVPTHALVVHAVVVLLPLAALAGIAVALAPPLRRRYGTLVGLLTVAAVASVPVATRSGEKLFARQSARFGPAEVSEAGLMEEHRELAVQLLPWALVLLAGVALVVVPPLLVRDRRPAASAAVPVRADRPGDSRTGDSRTGDSRTADSRTADSRTADSRTADSRTADSRTADSTRVVDPDARSRPGAAPGWTKPVALLGVAVTLLGAVLSLVLVIRIGHLGSQAAWERLDRPAAGLAPLAR